MKVARCRKVRKMLPGPTPEETMISLARTSHHVASRGPRDVVRCCVFDLRGAERVLAVRRAPRAYLRYVEHPDARKRCRLRHPAGRSSEVVRSAG